MKPFISIFFLLFISSSSFSQTNEGIDSVSFIENYLGIKLETTEKGPLVTFVSADHKLKCLGNFTPVGCTLTKMQTSGWVDAKGVALLTKEDFVSTLLLYKRQGFQKIFVMGLSAKGTTAGFRIDITGFKLDDIITEPAKDTQIEPKKTRG